MFGHLDKCFYLIVAKRNETYLCPIFLVHMLLCPLLESESADKSTLINSLSPSHTHTHSFLHQSIRRKDDPQEVRVQIQFLTYGTRPSKDKSGAYLFLPDGNAKVASGSPDWGEKQFIKHCGVN